MKILHNTYFLVLLLSLPPFVSIFLTSDLNHTHDGLVHLPRMAAYYKALMDGQLPVRWAGDLNYGYGMPLFIFIYHVPYLLSSLFISLGFSLVTTFKLVLFISYLLSGVFMFAFSRTFFKDERKALLVTIFYQFATFRFVELFIRGSFGEVYTYTFLPLVLLGLTLLFQKITTKYFIITVIGVSLLVISHNAISLLFFGICVGFILFFAKSKKQILVGASALCAGLLLSAFYWIPAIFEHKFTYGDLYMRNVYADHFPPLYQFFIPNLFNSKSLQTHNIAVQIGIFHMIGLVFAGVLFFKKKTSDIFFFSFVVFFTGLFFMQPISKVVWEKISLLRQFQFPWRFLSVIIVATSLTSVSYSSYFKKNIFFYTILFLVIISSVMYWRPIEGYDTVDESKYWDFPLNTTYYGETDVIWSAGPAKSYPKKRVEIIGGKGEIKNFKKKSNSQTFLVDAKTDIQIVDHTQYYPGWRAFIDGKETEIQFQDNNWRGEITFYIPKGNHDIRVVFGETKMRLIADTVSLLTLLLIFMAIFKKYLLNLSKRIMKIQ